MQYSLVHLSRLLTTLAQKSPSRKADSATMADASSYRSLVERLQVLKTAWILGSGDVPQAWFNQNASKKVLISRLHSGLAAFAANPSVTQPVGLKEAIMAEDFDLDTCLTKFGLDWEKAKAKTKSRKCNASWNRGLQTQGTTKLVERLKLLKSAWIHGNGEVPQPWFLQIGSKEVLITRLHAGLAAFAEDTSMTLPVDVQDAVMAEDFDFGRCLTRFGLSWEKARAKLNRRKYNAPVNIFSKDRAQGATVLVQRLRILKTAWIVGNGDVPQPWFDQRGSRKVLMSRLHSGLAAFAAKPSVTLPVGLQEAAMAENFDFESCLTKFGLDWVRTKKACYGRKKAEVFKYNKKFYQNVTNFCDNYTGLKSWYSEARANVIATDFPKSAYLVVTGRSSNNHKHIPASWKDGSQDLRDLKGAANLLTKRTKYTGADLLLVSREKLKRAAASAKKSASRRQSVIPEIAKNQRARKRPAKLLDS